MVQARVPKLGAVVAPSANTPLGHLRFLHGDGGKGYVTVARKFGARSRKPFDQRSGPFKELAEIVPAYGGMDDVYVSQNTFYGSRKKTRIAELRSLFSDIDYFKVDGLADMSPMGAFIHTLEALERARIPAPSLVVSTGRGLALVWRHEPVPRHVLKKWDLCQERIFDVLRPLGADPMAKDATRVLRLVGTRNSKSGRAVEAIWEDPEREVWDFGGLSDEILPLTREELEEKRARRREDRAEEEVRSGSKKPPKRRRRSAEGKTLRTLNEGRLSDLKRLAKLRDRNGEGVLDSGERDDWMFAAAVTMAYLWQVPDFERELIALGKEKAGWDEAETRNRMHGVIDRARKADAGETVDWDGQKRDPRYRLSNPSIIRDLSITPEEEAQLEVIISEKTKRQRDAARKQQQRRARGAVPRDEYIAEARERRQHHRREARAMKGEGKTLREIGDRLGISAMQVSRLLKATEGKEP